MAAMFSVGTGRPLSAPADRRGVRPCATHCLIRCESRCQDASPAQPSAAKLVLPGLLAAALLHSTAAHAGVILQKTENKKVYQGQKAAKQAAQQASQAADKATGGGGFSLPSLPAPSLPGLPTPSFPSLPTFEGVKTPELKIGGIEIDAKTIALPGAIAFLGTAFVAATKFDSGFGAFMNESMVKDSSNYAGYEEDPPLNKGSPKGFLGLGNLDLPSLPGGADTQGKLKSAASGKGLPTIGKKGTVSVGKAKKSAQKTASKGKGLFGFGK